MGESELPVDQRLGHLIKRAEQTLIGGKERVLREYGLTTPQYCALLILSEDPGLSGAELARRSFVRPQTMATILTNLESKDLITRCRSRDHAKVLVAKLTPSGRALLRKADKKAVALERDLHDAFSDDEREQFRTLLDRAIEAIAGHDADQGRA